MTTPIVTTYPAIVGACLAAKRKEHGLSQSELALSVGLTVSTWSRIENGESALTIEQLALAAQRLNLPPSELLINADKKVAELEYRGIETKRNRVSINEISASGAIPLVGSALFGIITSPAVAVGIAVAGLTLLRNKNT